MTYEPVQASSRVSLCPMRQFLFRFEEFAMDCQFEAVLALSDQTGSLLRPISAFPTT